MEDRRATLTLLLIFCVTLVAFPNVEIVKAEGTIYICSDGNVEGTDKIQNEGNIYTLTDNIVNQSIVVERFNIVFDGAGYTIQGIGAKTGDKRGIQIGNPYNTTIKTNYGVTVTNITIQDFDYGIFVFGYWGNIIDGMIIAGNNLTNNDIGISFSSYSSYVNNTIIGNHLVANRIGIHIAMGHTGDVGINQIVGNQIANNEIGMYFLWMGDFYSWKPNPFYMNNSIYHNNFISNNQNVVNGHIIYTPDCANIWDNGFEGNYWSDYEGIDANLDGIIYTPYIIDANNQDNYPLLVPVDITVIPEFPSWTPLLSTLVAVLVVAAIYRRRLANNHGMIE
ncbi:MAG: DUF1565 domain-containing protein [Candidatus Bathyarchaeota archaeon]|nr:MAG: DUF1565 domain-containing protein [Candidatus Bathyarchaeota archaeon]